MPESVRCGAIRRYLPIEQTDRADSLSQPLLGGDAECADGREDLAGPFQGGHSIAGLSRDPDEALAMVRNVVRSGGV